MSGTHVFYNGVHMQDCELLDFEEVVDMDETSGEVKYTRFRITVSSSIVRLQQGFADTGWLSQLNFNSPNINTTGFKAPPDGSQSAGLVSDVIQRITHDLSQPRQDFVLWTNSNAVGTNNSSTPQSNSTRTSSSRVLLAATGRIPAALNEYIDLAIGGTQFSTPTVPTDIKRQNVLDANLGPRVSGVKVSDVAGGAFAKFQATFEICRVMYQADASSNVPDQTVIYDAQKAKGIIHNRWSIVDSTDSEGKVSHEITGKITVKDHRYKANAMRLFAFPFAFAFARMTGKSHVVSEDGLTLAYKYKFEHAGAAPPAYVRDYKAVYTEGSGHDSGGKGFYRGSMTISVKGWYHRSTNDPTDIMTERQQKFFLLRGAYTILHSRIRGINPHWDPIAGQTPRKVQVIDCRVVEQCGKPELELSVGVMYTEADKTEFHLRLLNMGQPLQIPEYDPRWWPVDNEWGRMPAGDKDNPFFRSSALPYAAQGTPENSDYCSMYLQPPYSRRHTLPRLTGETKNDSAIEFDGIWEWARMDGSIVASGSDSSAARSPNVNPISQVTFSAYVSRDLAEQEYPAYAEPRTDESYTGVSIEQRSGFTYIQWDSEVLSDTNDGKIFLPLSKPRDIPNALKTQYLSMLPAPPSGVTWSTSNVSGKQCAVAVQLHAPVSKRVYSVRAARWGKWPQIPEPQKLIVRSQVFGSTASIACVETLLQKELITETPELSADQCQRLFVLDARYTYGMSNPWAGDTTEGGGNSDKIPVGRDPTQKATSEQNAITLRATSTSVMSPLFGSDSSYG